MLHWLLNLRCLGCFLGLWNATMFVFHLAFTVVVCVLLSHNQHALNCLKCAPRSMPRKKCLKHVVTALLMYLLAFEQRFFPFNMLFYNQIDPWCFVGSCFNGHFLFLIIFLDMCLWRYDYLRCLENIGIWERNVGGNKFCVYFSLLLFYIWKSCESCMNLIIGLHFILTSVKGHALSINSLNWIDI